MRFSVVCLRLLANAAILLLMISLAFTSDVYGQEEGQAEVEATDSEAPAAPTPLPAIGYTDAPLIPGTPWRVHDINRPRPLIVQVPPSHEPVPPPGDAIVLFDGTDLTAWRTPAGAPGALLPAGWKVQDGYMEVVPGSGSIRTVDTFGDMQLHLEWSAPDPPASSSQGRGNSGVIIMGRYEIQILDSYENPTYADGQAASVYGQHPPLVNVTRPPSDWNVYDIIFQAPRFDGEELETPGYVTVMHNGVIVQYHQEILGPVAHRGLNDYAAHPPAGALQLQDHDNPMRFRNIWVRRLELGKQ